MKRHEYEARTSFYIGGEEAEWVAKKLARKVADPEHKMKDEEIFFIAGSNGGVLRGYNGQPVILWPKQDNHKSIVDVTKHTNNFLDLFNPFVTSQDWREPFAERTLTYRYNIAYGSEYSEDIINRLVFEGVDKDNALTRLPIRLDLKPDGIATQVLPNWILSNAFLGEFVPTLNKDLATRLRNKKNKGKKKK